MEYDDFVVHVTPGQDHCYGIWVQSPAGEGKGRLELPPELGVEAGGAPMLATRELDEARNEPGRRPPTAREAGGCLFQALFKDGVRDLFYESLGGRGDSGRGLRIRLKIDPDVGRVLALPWELLYRVSNGDFLGADRSFSVVRSLDVHRRIAPAPETNRLRILAVSLSPRGYDDLDLAAERLILERAAKRWLAADIVFRKNPGRRELRAELQQGRFHVLHVMGHGKFDGPRSTGFLMFAGPDGEPMPVKGQELAAELKGCRDLRLVVLNTCHSARSAEGDGLQAFAGVASALVQGGVPSVVAMRSRISDRAALAFSETFYQQLSARDGGIDAAVAEGRLAIQRVAGEEGGWDLPVLFLSREDEKFLRRRSSVKSLILCLVFLLLVLAGGLIYGRSYEAIGLNENGAVLAQQGYFNEARGLLLEASRLDPGFAAPWSNLAVIAEQEGRYDEALKDARTAVEKSPGQAAYQYNLGRLLARSGDEREAVKTLRRATELEPCHAAAYNELGDLYLELGRPADARFALETALRCDRTSGPQARGPLLKNLGRSDLAGKKPGLAAQHLEQALYYYARDDRKDSWEPTYWLAEALAQNGQRNLACQRLREVASDAAGMAARGSEIQRLARREHCEGIFSGRFRP